MAAKNGKPRRCPICKIRPLSNHTRGRCDACYNAVRRRILTGEIADWTEAEKLGLVEPARKRTSALGRFAAKALRKAKG